MKLIHFFIFGLCLTMFSCEDKPLVIAEEETPTLPTVPYDYKTLNLPIGTQAAGIIFTDFEIINGIPVFTNSSMGITNEGASLGRVLFYDKKLSLNNTVSCGTCHHQDKGFADGKQFSTGFEGRVTTRNSMSIANPITQNNLFWDSRSKTIHDLSLQPVQNHIEMGMENLDRLVEKLENLVILQSLKLWVVNSSIVTEQSVLHVMAVIILAHWMAHLTLMVVEEADQHQATLEVLPILA